MGLGEYWAELKQSCFPCLVSEIGGKGGTGTKHEHSVLDIDVDIMSQLSVTYSIFVIRISVQTFNAHFERY